MIFLKLLILIRVVKEGLDPAIYPQTAPNVWKSDDYVDI